ncbi:MAG TPA: 50S ribosomal protein L15 [Candidatus Omnitrophota bacterium]|nr:50S ribosomal protein L15 [Candidatus Omnitrophota bacterium]HQO57485.1 50S ribosomal protein L15 [Candidatus Omnitrophota bacterium]
MQVHDLKPAIGAKKRRKIVGRGNGSGHGKTSCRGQTGQNSRSGRGIQKQLEGGQMRLIRRLPKVGFRSRRPVLYKLVSLEQLAALGTGGNLDAVTLMEKGFIKNMFKPYKVVGNSDIKHAFQIEAYSFSKRAEEIIKNAGGQIKIIDKKFLKEKHK